MKMRLCLGSTPEFISSYQREEKSVTDRPGLANRPANHLDQLAPLLLRNDEGNFDMHLQPWKCVFRNDSSVMKLHSPLRD